ncbi:hypothetical protein AGMMS49983_03980 [Clostridia bacterium]|nr:hypothetical protein AGMMS49983_03980 [Clostridia bacterium]
MAIDGIYNIIAKAPVGEQAGVLEFKTEGSVLTGIFTCFGTAYAIEDGKADGGNFELLVKLKGPVGTTKTTLTGSVDGDTILGQMKAGFTKMNFTGKRA